jgi:hypothetical protein
MSAAAKVGSWSWVLLAVACSATFVSEPEESHEAPADDASRAGGRRSTDITSSSAGSGSDGDDVEATGGAPLRPRTLTPSSDAGAGGGTGGDCGECQTPWYEVRCGHDTVSARNVESDDENDVAEACASGRNVRDVTAGGAGGEAPKLCDTYVAPPREKYGNGHGACDSWVEEKLVGQCQIESECCIVVRRLSCDF